jgi:hypothetical protein
MTGAVKRATRCEERIGVRDGPPVRSPERPTAVGTVAEENVLERRR